MTPEIPSKEIMLYRSLIVKDRVAITLLNHPSAKGDYNQLLHYYYLDWHGLNVPLAFFKNQNDEKLPSTETVTRRYRELAEAEKDLLKENPEYQSHFLPTERTLEKRETREDLFHAIYGNGQTHLNNGGQE